MLERNLLVFSVWALFGFGGLAFLLEGFSRDSYPIALIGIGGILAGLAAHVVVNAVFRTGFTQGELALAIGLFALFAVLFIGAWAQGGLSPSDYGAGLTLAGVLSLALPLYLATRHGFRGAFSRLGAPAPTRRETR